MIAGTRRGGAAALAAMVAGLLLTPIANAIATTKFVSKQYHYSLVLPGSPGSWQLASAFVGWSMGQLEPNAPQFDTLTDGRTGRFFIVGGRRLPAGSTLATWTSYFLSGKALACTRKSPVSNSTLGGEAARTFTFSCSDGVTGMGIDAVHGYSGYFMVLSTHSGAVDGSYRAEFSAARTSFRFAN